uniref:Transcription factor IIIB 70 kDa subunit n=1 Tax=Zeugodacus cucurbitae TaxID=28588 RepID=A0A0A1XI47_ZEUCU
MTLIRSFGNQLLQGLKTPLLTGCLARTMASQNKHPGYRSQCASDDPKCGKNKLKEKKDKDECDKKDKPKTSMWLNPECCLDICKDVLPRFDDLYYKPSDKAKRKYTRTWNECPDLRIAPRKICCFENISLPPIERRKKRGHPKTACPVVSSEQACSVKSNKRCIKIRLPGCGAVRDPPKCFVIKAPVKCRKICTPYPSFSECSRPKPKPRPPVECNCLVVGPLCGLH